MKHFARHLVVILLLPLVALLILGWGITPFPSQPAHSSGLAADGEWEELDPLAPPEQGNPKLESALAELVATFRRDGQQAASQEADRLAIPLRDGGVRVIVEAEPTQAGLAAAHAGSAGGAVEATYGNLIQVLVPIPALEGLTESPSVRLVRTPLKALPQIVSGEGVSLIQADAWQAAGITGAGVKVAIVDLGFSGYTALLGTELPSTVTAMSFRADADITGGGQPHGTAVAEIVHEVAPGAELYLINFSTEVELGNAVAWLITQGVQVVNHSIGWFGTGPGDGSGPINDIVNTAVSSDILWANSAGNQAQRHWSGTWKDTDGDDWHEFNLDGEPRDEGNTFSVGSQEVITAFLLWDDPFGASCNNYDLYLIRNNQTKHHSINVQNCSSDPVESLSFSGAPGTYFLAVRRESGDTDVNFHLYTFRQNLEHQVAQGSVGVPADNADVLTVGAVDWSTPTVIEPFSSQGPTFDGRTKPDIVGPDGVSSATFGTFFGTSASSPHAAAAAALVKQANDCFNRSQIQGFLEGGAVDLGDAGKDNVYGSGRLDLGALPPSDTDGDGLTDPCDPCPAIPDCDGDSLGMGDAFGLFFRDEVEAFLARPEDPNGLDPLDDCADTPTPDDEDDDKSGADFDDSQSVDGSDLFLFAERFGTEKDVPPPVGKQPYIQRFDIYPTDTSLHKIDGSDMFVLASYFGLTCGGP